MIAHTTQDLSSQTLINDNDDKTQSFKLEYYGAVNADRRYLPCIFPWLANNVIKQNCIKNVDVQISSSSLVVLDLNDGSTVQKHSLGSIYRLSRLKHCKLDNYFAYISLGATDLSPSQFHVFSSSSEIKKAEFLKTLKTKVLGFQKTNNHCPSDEQTVNISPPKPTHRRGVSSGAILISPLSSDAIFRDSVFYIGRVTISQPQAPPKFIDEVLQQFQKMHTSELTYRNKRTGSGTSLHNKFSFDDMSGSKVKRLSIDIVPDDDVEEAPRKRSSSCCSSDGFIESQYEKLPTNDENDVTLNNIQEEVQTRLVTFQISTTSLMLFSVGSKMMLLEKKISSISFCTKGEARNDHFGFICKEGVNHICYIFQGESEQKVDIIMKAMKHAFADALETSAHLKLCDYCPLQFIHKLCTKLEGALSVHDKKEILEEGMKYFTEYEQLHIMNKVNEVSSAVDDLEQVEVTINSMREIIDQKQKYHKHTPPKLQNIISNEENRERSRSATIFEKAKKSFASSLQSFAYKKPYGGRPHSLSQNNSIDISTSKPRSRSVNSANSCPVTPDFSAHHAEFAFTQDNSRRSSRSNSIDEVAKTIPQAVVEQEDEVTEMILPKKRDVISRKASWRQAIYHSVVTPSRRSSASSVITGEDDDKIKVEPAERAKARWKNAIMNQILLIRMEKENKKLAANISATETRRQKLSYQELASYSAESAKIWDNILKFKSTERVDDHVLLEAVRGGIPKARRGEIWQFLVKQNEIRIPATKENQVWKEEPYRSILRQNTNHKHAILIDLGRTFPTHAHFIPRLGSGQLGLYNILKAYSLFDDEVGYCQGLSFVAGVLLMHLNEEDAFKSFCHLMFDLTIRNQYKPDMNAVQQQLYQLSRLLHDYHPVLYEHFNKHDITPTLYAAPWFLTLYASQYPVGFVARVMDLVFFEGLEIIFKVALVLIGKHIDEILNCDSFESIVDYMKITLPENVIKETDEICTRALDMDIKQKLNLYEVEYQLLKEEMIDIRQNKERLEKQEQAQKQLEQQVLKLKMDLNNANSVITSLKASLELANQEKEEYHSQIRSLKAERDLLSLTVTRNKQYQNDNGRVLSDETPDKKDWELVPSPNYSSNGSLISINENGYNERSLNALMSPDYNTDVALKVDDVTSIKSSSSSIESEEVLLPVDNENQL